MAYGMKFVYKSMLPWALILIFFSQNFSWAASNFQLEEIKECVVCIGSMKLTGLSFKLDERAGGGNLRGKGSAAKKQSSCVVM